MPPRKRAATTKTAKAAPAKRTRRSAKAEEPEDEQPEEEEEEEEKKEEVKEEEEAVTKDNIVKKLIEADKKSKAKKVYLPDKNLPGASNYEVLSLNPPSSLHYSNTNNDNNLLIWFKRSMEIMTAC